MKTVQEIKKEYQEKTNKLMNDCGVFWAFSNEQFNENKTPKQEDEKYVSIGGGGYLPKSKFNQLDLGLKQLNRDEKKEIKSNKELTEKYILDVLENYETFYTDDLTAALEELKGYDKKLIIKVYEREKLKK